MKTTAEKIAIMQAYLDGKKVEFRPNFPTQSWAVMSVYTKGMDPATQPSWDWALNDYRVRPVKKDYINPDHIHSDFKFLTRNADGKARLWRNMPTYIKDRGVWFLDTVFVGTRTEYYGLNADIFASYKRGETAPEDSLVALKDLRDVVE